MSITKTRKKNSRFYWAELGFLALGLVGLNPTLLTDLLIGSTVPAPSTAPVSPFYGHPTSAPAYSPYGAYPPNTFAPTGWNGANQAYPQSAYFQQTGYGASQPTASTLSQPDIQFLASRVGEYLSSTASQWWNSQGGAQAPQDLRPSTAGLSPNYSNTFPGYPGYSATSAGYQAPGASGSYPPVTGSGQFGASNGFGSTGFGSNWQSQQLPTGAATTVPPPSYNVQGGVPFPSTSGATYSAQLPSGASAYAAPYGFNQQSVQQPNLVRGYSSNYQTLANPGSYVPAGSTANVMQQRQTQAGSPVASPSTQNGWANPNPSSTLYPAYPSQSAGMPTGTAPTAAGYYGRY